MVEKSGSWFAYEGEKLGQGRDNTRLFLKEHPEITEKIRKRIEAKAVKDGGLTLPAAKEAEAAPPEDKDVAAKDSRDKTARPQGIRAGTKKGE